jgi:ATP-dependent Lhr-like helicase
MYLFDLGENDFNELVEYLITENQFVFDKITKDINEPELCDSNNLEILLRIMRKSLKAQFEPLDIKYVPLFLAGYQNIIKKGDNIEDLQKSLDQLFGYPLNGALWEEYIFPDRFNKYYSSWIDSLISTTNLSWFGCGNKKNSFSFRDDIELFIDNLCENEVYKIKTLLPELFGHYSFFEIKDFTNMQNSDISKKLWEFCWKGMITNDSFETLRKGILNKFDIDKSGVNKNRRRINYNRWKSQHPLSGNWYVLRKEKDVDDQLVNIELTKDRVRILLDRYGIIFRELLSNELTLLQWKNIFRTLRLMELSGEILSGYFFKDIPGIQFISNEAFRQLQKPLDKNAIFWINACDPASVCGVKIDKLKEGLPARIASNIVVYHGTDVVLIAKKKCKDIEIFVQPDNLNLHEYFAFFKVLLTRDFNQIKKIEINKINNESALDSVYKESLQQFGFKKSYKSLELWRKF